MFDSMEAFSRQKIVIATQIVNSLVAMLLFTVLQILDHLDQVWLHRQQQQKLSLQAGDFARPVSAILDGAWRAADDPRPFTPGEAELGEGRFVFVVRHSPYVAYISAKGYKKTLDVRCRSCYR
jgi:hypothetical protein